MYARFVFLSREYPFLGTKMENCLVEVKFGSRTNFNMQNLIKLFFFNISDQSIPYDKTGSNYQSCYKFLFI